MDFRASQINSSGPLDYSQEHEQITVMSVSTTRIYHMNAYYACHYFFTMV